MPTEKDTSREETTTAVPPDSSSPTEDSTTDNSSTHETSPALESRTYLEIRPSTKPPNPKAVSQATTLLYESLHELESSCARSSFRNGTQQPIVEWLLVADGRSDTSMRYLVGTTHDAFLDDLEAILRTWFPDTYELTRVV